MGVVYMYVYNTVIIYKEEPPSYEEITEVVNKLKQNDEISNN